MKIKFIIYVIIFVISISVISFQFFSNDKFENTDQLPNEINKSKLDITSLFNIYGFEDQYQIINGKKTWNNVKFELNPKNDELYEKLLYSPTEKTVVIYPIFTSLAYSEPGFYTYYRGECGEECLILEIQKESPLNFFSSGNGFQVLKLLEYESITDIELDQNPDILKQYKKVILLHNEYVTKKEFNAITNHPNVVYLYPNALYAEIIVDYNNNSMTLHRGHNFPESQIRNGFDWEFDNSPMEYNVDCIDMGFDRIDNGWMLNCYPERAIHQSKVLLEMIKNF
ncbi:hypothetical protein [Nitrosopumilus sp.]|uniref:hypothetical protein n=1 Tax=Nitrosopumilus sp. TaxID=2024843 RepID=UPI00247D211F|nr:hypothetical protein [Nitrosopumilus sp.]MCV0430994.1 hypothetical protein [Nitrosopumilus sp.]